MPDIQQYTWLIRLIPLLPLAATVLIGIFGPRKLRGQSHWLAILAVAGSFVCSAMLLLALTRMDFSQVPDADKVLHQWTWVPSGAAQTEAAGKRAGWFSIDFYIDPLTALMLVTVTGVATLVVIYSKGYMREHDGSPQHGYPRYFAFVCLFVFSMSLLVLSGNFLLLYLGWEAVGLCSYLLIGFYYQRPSAAAAAKKAFLVNRIGDFGFGLGVMLIYFTFGTLDYHEVFRAVAAGGHGDPAFATRMTVITLLLFCGAVGKSAQLPLHVWLPDAMEGPSPVSALIHAATMVTAGVYMVARCGVMFAASPVSLTVVAVVGGLTALFAATIALAQYDLKRILAYSTISQLGYMFLGLGAAAPDSAIFHLFTHAFFKALLFLGAGSVMHAMHDVIDIRKFGGLRKHMPHTFWTFVLGSAALAGLPLLSGFFSKDDIIHAAWEHAPVLGLLSTVTAWLTIFYSARMVFLTFFGEEKLPEGVSHAHESGRWMTIPLWALAIGAVFSGWLGHSIYEFLRPSVQWQEHGPHGALFYVVAILPQPLIILAAYYLYALRPDVAAVIPQKASRAFGLLNRKYYVDEIYDRGVVRPAFGLGLFCYAFDNYVIDSLVWLATAIPRGAGALLRGLQQGALQGYALSMICGIAAILVLMLVL